MAAAPSTSSVRPKEFHFPVKVEWLGCELEALTGGRSVPQLLVDGPSIGRFDELAPLERSGGLRRLARAEWAAAPLEGQ